MPATTLAARLPDIATVRRWSQSLAVLDAILSPAWEYRYFSFDAHWDSDEQLASMRNGSGDEYSITFTPAGAYLRGFDHESDMSPYAQAPTAVWRGVVDHVPAELAGLVAEPAFCDEGVPRVTVCLWRRPEDDRWRHGPVTFPEGDDPDGADWLFAELDGRPETYHAFALEYYERDVDLSAVAHVYRHEPLADALVSSLNPQLSLADLDDDLRQIGYRS